MNIYDVYSFYPVAPVRGQGSYVYDAKGQKYLDFYGGHAVISIGHSHPHYVKSLSEQLQQIGFYSNSVENPLQIELADKLEAAAGISGYDIFYINSGAEANDNALKLASFYNGRSKVIALENSFHGRTSAAINVTHTGIKHQAPINHGVDATYVHYQDTEAILAEIRKGDAAAIIIEAIQGVGGLDDISAESLVAIRAACDETDTIMIMDEVQSGYGRSGHFFAYQIADIRPDIITTAKGMGNGFPIGSVIIDSAKIPATKGRLGTTYGGNFLACAAGIAVLDVIKNEQLIDNVQRCGQQLAQILTSIPGIKTIKGRGLMVGAEFDFPVAAMRKSMVLDHFLFTGSSANPNLLRILPPLNINAAHLEEFEQKLTKAVNLHLSHKS